MINIKQKLFCMSICILLVFNFEIAYSFADSGISSMNKKSFMQYVEKIPKAGQTYEKYPALKDVYKDYFTMGIFGPGEENALLYNFDAFTPGNEMKPDYTQSNKGNFTYNSADNEFNKLSAKNPKMVFYGHTLAWHSQSPTWMWDAAPARFEQTGTFDKSTALDNLNNHIENVLAYYGGRLEGIDVVNEAIGTVDPNDWKASIAKGEGWYMALGWEWVEKAFLKAAKVVDSHPEWNCKLIYNDFGLDSPNKARVVYEMVKDINNRYDGVRPNGKPLIEVIGMQAHYNLSTNISNVENSIKLFATLKNVSINITEMDIGCPPGTQTSEVENNQAMKFAELFSIYKKYSSGIANTTNNPKVINRVSICGVRDALTGWKAGEFALLFNSEGLAKEALIAVLDPDEFLSKHEYIELKNEKNQEPVDGINIFDASKGDSWTGANIILGNDSSKWPWSTTEANRKVAFIPEKDATYRLSFNYTAKGTSAIRVRWIKDNSNNIYTDADGVDVNKYQYTSNQVATTIPAYFNSGMVNMGSYTLTTEIKLDGMQPANGLIGNIAIRGGAGGSAYSINWIKIEKIGTDINEIMASWPKEESVISEETSTIPNNNEIKVLVNNNLVEFDVNPCIVNDRTLVPFRKVFESLGAKVSWDESTQAVIGIKDDMTISLKIGSRTATVNGTDKELDVSPIIIDGRTMIPLRFISENLGYSVLWEDDIKTIKISN